MKRVKYMALALVLVLGLIGGAYGIWYQTITVEGTVKTGDIDPVFVSAVSNDVDCTDPGWDKNVGKTTVEIVDGGKKLLVTVDNAYPGYVSRVDFVIKNQGSVPVKLNNKNIQISHPNKLEVENSAWFCFNCWRFKKYCICPPCPPEEEPPVLDIGTQLGPGKSAEGSIGHLVTERAGQGETYTYTVSYEFVQWNYGPED